MNILDSTIPLPGDVLLVHGTGPISRTIEAFEDNQYSHSALFVGPNLLYEANDFRRVGPQDPQVYAGHSDLYRCDILSRQDRKRIVNVAKSFEGRTYDYGLLAIEAIRYLFGVFLPWREHGKLICSTYISDSYRESAIDLCHEIKYPTPADLSQSRLLRRVGLYNG